jgi:hypothetical protein
MKQQTIKEVLSENGGIQEADYRLYLMRDGETVFYVGQSRNPHNRFLSHLGMDGRSSPSEIGRFIRKNASASDAWLFEQYTLEEAGDHSSSDAAERALIARYRPCFNTMANPDRSPLPARYRDVHSEENTYGEQLVRRFGIKHKASKR